MRGWPLTNPKVNSWPDGCGDPGCELCGSGESAASGDLKLAVVQKDGKVSLVESAEPKEIMPPDLSKKKRATKSITFSDQELMSMGYSLRYMLKVINNEAYYKKVAFPFFKKTYVDSLTKLAEHWETAGSGANVPSAKIEMCELDADGVEMMKVAEKAIKAKTKVKKSKKKVSVVEVMNSKGDHVSF